jgi:hypothetical protein
LELIEFLNGRYFDNMEIDYLNEGGINSKIVVAKAPRRCTPLFNP